MEKSHVTIVNVICAQFHSGNRFVVRPGTRTASTPDDRDEGQDLTEVEEVEDSNWEDSTDPPVSCDLLQRNARADAETSRPDSPNGGARASSILKI